jgi:hypothetical protein
MTTRWLRYMLTTLLALLVKPYIVVGDTFVLN